jgi:hypothetical protein
VRALPVDDLCGLMNRPYQEAEIPKRKCLEDLSGSQKVESVVSYWEYWSGFGRVKQEKKESWSDHLFAKRFLQFCAYASGNNETLRCKTHLERRLK